MQLIAGSQDYIHGGTQKDEYSDDEVIEVDCPYCGSNERTRLYTEHGSVGISQCVKCNLIYTSPRIHSPEEIYWGDANIYFQEVRLIFEERATHHRDPNYMREIKAIERYKKSGRFLDVGCNAGMLLRLARKRGWDVVGLEPSPSLSSIAKKHGFPVYHCFLNELPKHEENSFDVVAFSDVFEHITDPQGFLNDARKYLKPDGLLYVKVPNVKWSIFKQKIFSMMGKQPKQGLWDSYEHVVHYSDKTLKKMLDKCGFKLLRISLDPPVQTPNWHEYVGQFFQYPTPLFMDWQRKLVRVTAYRLSGLERLLRFGSVGYLAPNLVAVEQKV